MKVLHTSDWHLGQSFFTKSRKSEHEQFFKWLVDLVEQEAIDAVIVAGDIFDTGTPPSYARELYHQLVGRFQGMGCTLVVLGGNHDSVSVLNESRELLSYLNCHVIASTYGDAQEQVLPLTTRKGKTGAILCAVPFIRARDVLKSQAGESAVEKRKALGEAIKQHYAHLYQIALKKRDELNVSVPIIATGHLTALGVSQSESVRDIYIGTLEGFAADGFPPADYIALGHIHRPQKVAGCDHIRYSGSPIPLSFDELKSQKQVLIATFEKQSLVQVESMPIPRFQAMEVLRGNLDDIALALQQSEAVKSATEAQPAWLCIEVETQDYLTDLQQRIQALIDDKPAEILQLKRMRKQRSNAISAKENVNLSELSVQEVFNARLSLEAFESDDDKLRKQRIQTLFEQVVDDVQLAHVDNEGDNIDNVSVKVEGKEANATDAKPDDNIKSAEQVNEYTSEQPGEDKL
ncbi:exonuclease subunit SbcD [Alteromonas sp. 1_MG-2023]|uniref:exonuclease subunit SbcD n=1 Tax=Alteromonas sp. 1_MG-2023 TaxID=3062669 RepID=UPI0026E22473|nr:exonuclease subunit SbcD [Alteromonas sp. 1_MG-2023]MDO6565548.1 exonuclease subunit SbcD [Alteromonas sp. 1_MG-2023]